MNILKQPSAKDSLDSIIRKIYDDMNSIASNVQSEKQTSKADRVNDMRFVKDQTTGQHLIEVRFKEGWKKFPSSESAFSNNGQETQDAVNDTNAYNWFMS